MSYCRNYKVLLQRTLFRKNPLSIHNNYKFSCYILYVTMVALPLVVESHIVLINFYGAKVMKNILDRIKKEMATEKIKCSKYDYNGEECCTDGNCDQYFDKY